MVRQRKIPVRALGSMVTTPSARELAAWAKTRTGVGGDLTTFHLMRSAQAQDSLDLPAAGGWFYGGRATTATVPDAPLEEVVDDIRAVESFFRNPWWSLPSPASLRPDPDEEYLLGYRGLLRTMRDNRVAGHIILSERRPEPIELEFLTGRRVLWHILHPSEKSLATLLEVQRDIAIRPDMLEILDDLMGSYTIRKIIVIDPGEGDLKRAAELVDADNILTGGYAPADQADYWKDLASRSILGR